MTIRTPDQRLRVFVSSTLTELAEERRAARAAITNLRLTPVMFELGARPHPPRELYRSYLAQSNIFIGIYWQKYGWIAPDMSISGIEDEYNLSGDKPKLIYIQTPAADREPRLQELIQRIQQDNVSYKHFSATDELQESIENDLAMVLTERFDQSADEKDAETPIRPKSNIPNPRNPLVGRDRQLEIACDLLRRADIYLVTLTGPAGTGKSRLALHIALELLHDFVNGAYLVDLTPIHDPELVIPSIARVIGTNVESGRGEVIKELKDYLRTRHMLLLLDNFEQVVSAAPYVAELVESCPQLKIMVTSRVPLRVRMEKVLFVPPLALPDLELMPTPERLSQYAAVELFRQRAQDLMPEFTINPQNARLIAEICHQLDGLPLAIELAAPRIKLLSPQDLLAELDHSLDILTGGGRDLPTRQKTLRRAIGWSYDLLDDRAKGLFRRLAVFTGGWTLEAVGVICEIESDPRFDFMDDMQRLIDSNLVTGPVETRDAFRFDFFQTIHEFASEKLAEANEEEQIVRRKHAQYYLALTEGDTLENSVHKSVVWCDLLESEQDNLRAALNWSLESSELEFALRLCTALKDFWLARSYITEGRRWIEFTLNRLNEVSDENIRSSLRANAYSTAGILARIQGDLGKAKRYHHLALDLRRKIGDKKAIGHSLNGLGIVVMFQGDYIEAQGLFEESLELARLIGDELGTVHVLNNLGIVEMYLMNLDRALQLHEEVLAIYQTQQDQGGVAGALGNMGDVLRYQGNYARAQVVLQESLEIFREAQDKQGMAITLSSLGRVYLSLHDGKSGSELYRESLSLLRDVGDRVAIADCFEGLAVSCSLEADQRSLEEQRDCLQRGAKLIAVADALRESVGTPIPSTDRAEYERTLGAIRDQFDKPAFEKLWHEGQIMTLEQAISFALEEDIPGCSS